MVGWMQETIAGFGMCMGADRVGCVAYAMSSAGVLPTNGRGNLFPVGGKISGYMLASASSISPRAGGLEYRQLVLTLHLGAGVVGRVKLCTSLPTASRSLKASTNSTMHRTPQLWTRIWPCGGVKNTALLDMIRIVSQRNKADGWVSRTCDWPTRR